MTKALTGPGMSAAGRIAASLLIAASSLLVTAPAAAFQDDVEKNRTELNKLRSEINEYEKKMKESGKKETTTLAKIDTYRKQESNLRNLIRKLQKEESRLENSIGGTGKEIETLSDRIEHLKKSYAEYVRGVYMKGRTYDVEMLISSTSVNQLLVRAEYLRRFTGSHRQRLEEIGSARTELDGKKTKMERELREQHAVIDEKSSEKRNLTALRNDTKKALSKIRKDKQFYQTQIERRKADFRKVEQKIAALIDKEKGSPAPVGKGKFASSRGKLAWPVAGGKIVTRFGNQKHPVLKTVSENNGLDIGVAQGSSVAAVADGEVSTIWWLPSYGNLVIVNHDGGYRTVYAHLGDVDVEEGQPVATGQRIGRSGEGLDGPMLHFEIWNGRETQDPEKWLSPGGLTKR